MNRPFATLLCDGTDLIPAGGEKTFDASPRLHSFVMGALAFTTDWEPPPLPWYWNNRVTRWALRRLRRLPPNPSPPLRFRIILGAKYMAMFSAPHFGLGRTRTFEFWEGRFVVFAYERLAITVMNDGDRDLRVIASALGYQEAGEVA